MSTLSSTCPRGCRGECLHAIEFMPYQDPSEAAFCDFVCQFMSKDPPPVVVCMEQPCANVLL
jgi:hypothetical protein